MDISNRSGHSGSPFSNDCYYCMSVFFDKVSDMCNLNDNDKCINQTVAFIGTSQVPSEKNENGL